MTFKNIKFDDSVVMRSFARVAKEKKLITESEKKNIVKTAKNNLFYPTNNFQENIVKLCEGLRVKGFDKLAEDLEYNFLNYKKAENLYNVSKETGEDLVDEAHPDGSHTVEDVEGDAVVETIVDQKSKIEKVVNKNPTGKLAARQQEKKNKISLADGAGIAGLKADFRQIKRINIHNIVLGSIRDSVNNLLKISENIEYILKPKKFDQTSFFGSNFIKLFNSLLDRDIFEQKQELEKLEIQLSKETQDPKTTYEKTIESKNQIINYLNKIIQYCNDMIESIDENKDPVFIKDAKEQYKNRILFIKNTLENNLKLFADNVYETDAALSSQQAESFNSENLSEKYFIKYINGLSKQLKFNMELYQKSILKNDEISKKISKKLLLLIDYINSFISVYTNIYNEYQSPKIITIKEIKDKLTEKIKQNTTLNHPAFLPEDYNWINLNDLSKYNNDIFSKLSTFMKPNELTFIEKK